jgi:hypothetical protein
MISEDRYQLQKKTWSVNHEGPLKSGLDNADTTVTAADFSQDTPKVSACELLCTQGVPLHLMYRCSCSAEE